MDQESLLQACKERRIITQATEKQWRRLLERASEPTSRILEAYRSFPMQFCIPRSLARMSNAGEGKLDSNSPFDESMDPIAWGIGTGRIFPYLHNEFKTLQELEPSTIKELISTLPVTIPTNLTIHPPDPQRDLRKAFRVLQSPQESPKDESGSHCLESIEPTERPQTLISRLVSYLSRTFHSTLHTAANQAQQIQSNTCVPDPATDGKTRVCLSSETGLSSSTARFPEPKILLLNIGNNTAERLHEAGYDAFSGEIGMPYRVQPGDRFYPVPISTKLPAYTEQEIIIIDLGVPQEIKNLPINISIQEGVDYWWAKEKQGLIDPRPGVLASLSEDFTRILQNGGVFIIFAAIQLTDQFILGQLIEGRIRSKGTLFIHVWGFPPQLSSTIQPIQNKGSEIKLSNEATGWLQELTSVSRKVTLPQQ